MTDPKENQRVTVAVDPVELRAAEPPGTWINVRKAGRASLRVLRPLAMPFLRRFEARVRTAVWQTGLVEDVSRIGVRADQILTEIRQQAEAPGQPANQVDAALRRHAEAVMESTAQANKMFQEHARLMEQATTSTQDSVQAINAAVARLEAASARHTVQIEALGRSVPHIKMTALRVEEAMAIEAKRLSLMHEALCTVLASLEPQTKQVNEGFVGLRTALSEISAAMTRSKERVEQDGETARTLMAAIAGHTAQLVNRNMVPLPGTEYAVRTPTGYVVVPADDTGLLIYLAEGMGHELGTIKTLEALLDPGDTAIDVGAHIGMMAVPMARRVGPSGSVHLFEPSPKTAACLRQTLLLNGLQPWTTVVESAVNDQPGRATLHFGTNSALNSLLPTHPETASGTEVDVIRLDDAILPGTSVSVLKIDAEGAELGVLNGMPRILAENPDLIIVAEFARSHLERSGSVAADWLGAFASIGMDVALRINEATGACTPVVPADLSAAAEPMNLVLARHSAPRLTRLSAPP